MPKTTKAVQVPVSRGDFAEWVPGDRVGRHGSPYGHCDPCRSGDCVTCSNLTITGLHSSWRAFPILSGSPKWRRCCAPGVTTYNALRHIARHRYRESGAPFSAHRYIDPFEADAAGEFGQ